MLVHVGCKGITPLNEVVKSPDQDIRLSTRIHMIKQCQLGLSFHSWISKCCR